MGTAPFLARRAFICSVQYASAARAVPFQSPPGAKPDTQDAASGEPHVPRKPGAFLNATSTQVFCGTMESQPDGSAQKDQLWQEKEGERRERRERALPFAWRARRASYSSSLLATHPPSLHAA